MSSPVPLHALDRDGRLVGVSDDWLALLGYERQEVIGRPITDFMAASFVAVFHAQIWPLLQRAKEVREVDVRFVRKTGEIVEARVSARLPGEEGRGVYTLAVVFDITARRRVEEALIQSEDRFRLLSEATLEGVVIHDGARIVDANSRLAEMFGWRLDEIIGGSPLDSTLPQYHSLMMEKARNGNTAPYEVLAQRKDGTTFPAEFCGRTIQWNGKTARVVIIRDLTQRKHAERELRESKEQLELAQQAAGIGSWDMDLTTGEMRWSPEFYRLLDLAPGLPPSIESFLGVIAPEHREEMRSRIGWVIEHSASYCNEFRILRSDGARWMLGRGRVITVDGRPLRMIGIIMDITERKLVEDALRREKDFSHRVIESIGEGMYAYDREGRVTLWNASMERQFDVPREKVVGRLLLERFPWHRGTVVGRAISDAIAGRETKIEDGSFIHPTTGRQVRFESHHSPLRNTDGEVIGGIVFVRDTTERRQMEAALRQAQKMEAVGELTGGIAHDFNNMLTIIAGNLEMLDHKLVKEPALRRLATAALFGVSRAERLTQHLLAFARRQRLDPRNVDIAVIVDGMREVLKGSVSERIVIGVEMPTDLWPAYVDTNQLETALLNLVINARDAMAMGGRIDITARNVSVGADGPTEERRPGPGDYVLLAVSDTGAGMPPDVLARVFEPFFTTKAAGKGSGLGLAMVHGFARQSGGHAEIESTVGEGTTVTLYLPRARAVDEPLAAFPSSVEAPRGQEAILVVEDECDVRRFSVELLADLGYTVHEAADGEAALKLLDTHRIDLLFCDVVLPGPLSGPEIAKVAQRNKPELKVLLTSGYVPPSGAHGAIDSRPFIRKPFRPRDLAARIRATLDAPAG